MELSASFKEVGQGLFSSRLEEVTEQANRLQRLKKELVEELQKWRGGAEVTASIDEFVKQKEELEDSLGLWRARVEELVEIVVEKVEHSVEVALHLTTRSWDILSERLIELIETEAKGVEHESMAAELRLIVELRRREVPTGLNLTEYASVEEEE